MRMPERRWPKRALSYTPINRRRGRPTETWKKVIEQSMKDRAIEENEWVDRKRWRAKCEMRRRPYEPRCFFLFLTKLKILIHS